MHSPSAERLILGTGAIESRYQYLRQYPSGIARSYWQIETATCLDNIKNYLVYRKSKLKKIADIEAQEQAREQTNLDRIEAQKQQEAIQWAKDTRE